MSIDVQTEPRTARQRLAIHAMPSPTPPMPRSQPKTGSVWKRGLLTVGVLGVVAAAAFALIRTPQNSTIFLTHSITRGDLIVSVTEEGILESSSNKEIKCKVKGGSTVLWVIESGTEVQPGDELVRLDTATIEDNINQQKITYQMALATYAQSESDVVVAEISLTEYLEGTFRGEMKTAQSNVAIAQENLRVSQNILDHSQKMFRKGYISQLELDGKSYSVEHAKLELDVMETQVDVLEKYTKPKMLTELESTLKASRAKLASDKAALDLEKARLDRDEQQLDNCVILAEVGGIVIYPSAAQWKREPDIEEGAAVREDQVLLMMPDLNKMQVTVGIHEAKIERITPGMQARIELQNTYLDGDVLSVASIAKPAGWWTGNVVKYDTIIKVDSLPGLKPGMSATVELFLAVHNNVLTIPVAAVVEQIDGFHCWVKTEDSTQRRRLELGDSNDQFVVVHGGLKEGDEVVLDPLAYVDEAQVEALKPIRGEKPHKTKRAKSDAVQSGSGKPTGAAKPNSKPGAAFQKPVSKTK